MLSKKEIADDLNWMGLKRGERLIFHTSLKSIGFIKGEANTLIDALVETVGSEGIVMAPTFTFGRGIYDPRTSPAVVGKVADTFFRRKDAVRSLHPSHSVAAIGKDAPQVVSGHENTSACGPESPLARIARQGGYILLIGVDQTVNTTLHCAEVAAQLPYILKGRAKCRTSIYGEVREVEVPCSPGCSRGFYRIEPILRKRKVIKEGKIGKAKSQLMLGQALIDTAVEVLKRNPTALLCLSNCKRCETSRQVLKNSARGIAC